MRTLISALRSSHLTLVLAFLTLPGLAFANNTGSIERPWLRVPAEQFEVQPGMEAVHQLVLQRKATLFALDEAALARLLARAPMERSEAAKSNPLSIDLPLPDGSYERFSLEESPILRGALAAKYPSIKTYRLRGLTSASSGRLSYTASGVTAYVKYPKGAVRVLPIEEDNGARHASFFARDLSAPFDCGNDAEGLQHGEGFPAVLALENRWDRSAAPLAGPLPSSVTSDGVFREYILMIAMTHAFKEEAEATPAGVMGSVVNVLTNVNGVYESELAISFTLHEDTELLFDPANAPWDDTDSQDCADDASELKSANPVAFNAQFPDPLCDGVDPFGVCDPALPDPQCKPYHLGHLFAAPSPPLYGRCGYAVAEALCNESGFGAGCSVPNRISQGASKFYPTDPGAYITVLHEIGHQLGAHHTFSSSECTPNQAVAGNQYEPGSGSTLMSYAGNCGAHNVQTMKDDYYHRRSLEQIRSWIETDLDGSSCFAIKTPNWTQVPSVGPLTPLTIPINTRFTLAGVATDEDPADVLTYTWEQYDPDPDPVDDPLNPPTPFIDDVGPDPIFRTFVPQPRSSSVFTRTFADLSVPGVKLPTLETEVAPNEPMNMCLVVRDGRGGLDSDCMKVSVKGGPFDVYSSNRDFAGPVDTVRIAWHVNGTNSTGYARHVRILTATSAGGPYSVVKACTPNDGIESITAPHCTLTQQFVRVESLSPACVTCPCVAPTQFFFDDIAVFTGCPGPLGLPDLECWEPTGQCEDVCDYGDDCDDENPCTIDQCMAGIGDPEGLCQHQPVSGSCESNCTDHIDNDHDGFTDCADTNCAGVGDCP